MMEGSVSVSSEYGKGSTFHIEIPQEIVDDTPVGSLDLKTAPDQAPASHPNRLTAPGLRILAVDDTPMNLMVVKKLLRDSGAVVETASGGTEALRKTLTTHYDLILMDHQMPGMDGITCLHRIREQESGMCRDSRVVCLTANVGADMEARYREAGFDGYLVKPVRGKTLEEEIARLLPSAPHTDS
jgi:CheY-like chemotaxis protein